MADQGDRGMKEVRTMEGNRLLCRVNFDLGILEIGQRRQRFTVTREEMQRAAPAARVVYVSAITKDEDSA